MTILSLLVQGTTVIAAGRRLGLMEQSGPGEDAFGVDLADEHPTSLRTVVLTDDDLARGNTLRDMSLPEGSLVMMIRRDGRYIVPNGRRRLQPGDALLIIEESGD